MLLELPLRLLVLRPDISIAKAMSGSKESEVMRIECDVPSIKSSFLAQQLVLPICAFAQRIDRRSRQLEVYRIPV